MFFSPFCSLISVKKYPDIFACTGHFCYDLGLQNENLVLKAWELGYGTVIMGLRTGDKLREILSLRAVFTDGSSLFDQFLKFHIDPPRLVMQNLCNHY